jgi:cytoskeletal protein RodZ
MNEFGTHLKQARERRGISLRQIAAATKISTGQLESLERGDFSRLPGGIFSRAFVRAYAVEVGLDADETVRQYTELSDAQAASASNVVAALEITDDDRQFLERQRKAGVLLRVAGVVLLIAIAGGIGAWQVMKQRKAGSTPAPAADTTAPPAAEPSLAAVTPASSAPASAHAIFIEIKATASCWVSVTADGRSILSRSLAEGESQVIEADREIALQFGNAGAITWTVNGKPAKPLGVTGEVRRATITKDTLSSFWR